MNLFVLDLTYTGTLDEVDALMAEHRTWLDEHYAAGSFIASGRKNPRTGGVILARAASRAQVEALVADDPFARGGVVAYHVTEFVPTKTSEELAAYRVHG